MEFTRSLKQFQLQRIPTRNKTEKSPEKKNKSNNLAQKKHESVGDPRGGAVQYPRPVPEQRFRYHHLHLRRMSYSQYMDMLHSFYTQQGVSSKNFGFG